MSTMHRPAARAPKVARLDPGGRQRRWTRRHVLGGTAATASALLTGRAIAEPAEVDLLLVLAADISRSVDEKKFRLQRQGYAAALTHPRVLRAIESGPSGRIAICFVEWSGVGAQLVVADWLSIAGKLEAEALSARILSAPRAFMDRTAIGMAVEYSMAQLARAPFRASRSVIDVSGDGTNTNGRDPASARDEAMAKGIVINGIAILSEVPLPQNPLHTHPPGGLLAYYENNVIGGPGAFALPAESFEVFGDSLISKLVKEIADSRREDRMRA